MQRLGDTTIIFDTIVYLILFILFFLGMFFYVRSHSNNAAFWEDFYAKEIAYALDRAEQGMEMQLDVSRLAAVAVKGGKPLSEIIFIDNVGNKVIASGRVGSGTSFGFFNDIDVIDQRIESPSGGETTTRLIFKVKERQR